MNLATKEDTVCLAATTGMAYFRTGNDFEGRRYYEAAIELARQVGNDNLVTLAKVHFARERLLRGDKDAVLDFMKAYEAAMKLQETNIPAVVDHMAKEIAPVVAHLK
ncbi:MAG TPA: hypothetical protein VL171_09595 [Verrucomicrobiae bacterium]|nr:hypothetical protein [Verrucomicrobiae bacterium]